MTNINGLWKRNIQRGYKAYTYLRVENGIVVEVWNSDTNDQNKLDCPWAKTFMNIEAYAWGMGFIKA